MNENKVKSINGVIVKHYLLEALQKCQEQNVIVYCSKDFRCVYEKAGRRYSSGNCALDYNVFSVDSPAC
jgi:hypothetical protein